MTRDTETAMDLLRRSQVRLAARDGYEKRIAEMEARIAEYRVKSREAEQAGWELERTARGYSEADYNAAKAAVRTENGGWIKH
jgi:hypothetical protein